MVTHTSKMCLCLVTKVNLCYTVRMCAVQHSEMEHDIARVHWRTRSAARVLLTSECLSLVQFFPLPSVGYVMTANQTTLFSSQDRVYGRALENLPLPLLESLKAFGMTSPRPSSWGLTVPRLQPLITVSGSRCAASWSHPVLRVRLSFSLLK